MWGDNINLFQLGRGGGGGILVFLFLGEDLLWGDNLNRF